MTAAFARSHDKAVLGCLRELSANDSPPLLDALATKGAQLPLHFGGLGLRSADTSRIAAHWASWADSLPTLRGRHPVVVEGLLSQAASQRRGEGGLLPCVAAALSSQSCLQRAGFLARTWHQLIETTALKNRPLRGWQRAATQVWMRQRARASFLTLTRLLALAAHLPSPRFPPRWSCLCPRSACAWYCFGG